MILQPDLTLPLLDLQGESVLQGGGKVNAKLASLLQKIAVYSEPGGLSGGLPVVESVAIGSGLVGLHAPSISDLGAFSDAFDVIHGCLSASQFNAVEVAPYMGHLVEQIVEAERFVETLRPSMDGLMGGMEMGTAGC
jgi:hypothetical protein